MNNWRTSHRPDWTSTKITLPLTIYLIKSTPPRWPFFPTLVAARPISILIRWTVPACERRGLTGTLKSTNRMLLPNLRYTSKRRSCTLLSRETSWTCKSMRVSIMVSRTKMRAAVSGSRRKKGPPPLPHRELGIRSEPHMWGSIKPFLTHWLSGSNKSYCFK